MDFEVIHRTIAEQHLPGLALAIQQGDTLVTVGKAGQYGPFRRLLREGPFPAPA